MAEKDLTDEEIKVMLDELEQFRTEKERVKMLMGQIGGISKKKYDKSLNYIFIVLIILLFAFDMARHIFHWELPLPDLFSLEIGILFVSLKIVWMMLKQSKLEHFQFWILNSIEYKLNQISTRLNKLLSDRKK